MKHELEKELQPISNAAEVQDSQQNDVDVSKQVLKNIEEISEAELQAASGGVNKWGAAAGAVAGLGAVGGIGYGIYAGVKHGGAGGGTGGIGGGTGGRGGTGG